MMMMSRMEEVTLYYNVAQSPSVIQRITADYTAADVVQ